MLAEPPLLVGLVWRFIQLAGLPECQIAALKRHARPCDLSKPRKDKEEQPPPSCCPKERSPHDRTLAHRGVAPRAMGPALCSHTKAPIVTSHALSVAMVTGHKSSPVASQEPTECQEPDKEVGPGEKEGNYWVQTFSFRLLPWSGLRKGQPCPGWEPQVGERGRGEGSSEHTRTFPVLM